MDHYFMRLVLGCVGELWFAKSRDVANRLGLDDVRYVSSMLKKCKDRGYVKREPYKRGREHG
jgi:Mn-dependent DtxR family transcriptional regulator